MCFSTKPLPHTPTSVLQLWYRPTRPIISSYGHAPRSSKYFTISSWLNPHCLVECAPPSSATASTSLWTRPLLPLAAARRRALNKSSQRSDVRTSEDGKISSSAPRSASRQMRLSHAWGPCTSTKQSRSMQCCRHVCFGRGRADVFFAAHDNRRVNVRSEDGDRESST